MSFVKFKKQAQIEEVNSAPPLSQNMHMRIDVAPIPIGASSDISMEKRQVQTQALQRVRTKGRDLFMENPAVVSNTAGDRLYQTKELYSQNLSVEDMIPMLTNAELTLRVNAVREGVHAHSTCMELKTGALADLLGDTADKNGEKSVSLQLPNGEKGEMFVSIKSVKGKHYINKVDYKVSAFEDDRLHII